MPIETRRLSTISSSYVCSPLRRLAQRTLSSDAFVSAVCVVVPSDDQSQRAAFKASAWLTKHKVNRLAAPRLWVETEVAGMQHGYYAHCATATPDRISIVPFVSVDGEALARPEPYQFDMNDPPVITAENGAWGLRHWPGGTPRGLAAAADAQNVLGIEIGIMWASIIGATLALHNIADLKVTVGQDNSRTLFLTSEQIVWSAVHSIKFSLLYEQDLLRAQKPVDQAALDAINAALVELKPTERPRKETKGKSRKH